MVQPDTLNPIGEVDEDEVLFQNILALLGEPSVHLHDHDTSEFDTAPSSGCSAPNSIEDEDLEYYNMLCEMTGLLYI